MKRGLVIFVLSLICCTVSWGKDHALPKFTFGAEWGYMPTFLSGYHYNFFAPDGYRVDMDEERARYFTNGEALFHAGYNLNDQWNLSLYLGYTGISDIKKKNCTQSQIILAVCRRRT